LAPQIKKKEKKHINGELATHFFVVSPLLPPTEVCLQSSAILGGNPPRDLQLAVG
jgi:hypothetical protein